MAFVRCVKGAMSKVYSFRLDTENPREAQAISVIEFYASQGYSLRHSLTEALINFPGNRNQENRWESICNQLSELLYELDKRIVKYESSNKKPSLSQEFLVAMKKAAKPGIVTD